LFTCHLLNFSAFSFPISAFLEVPHGEEVHLAIGGAADDAMAAAELELLAARDERPVSLRTLRVTTALSRSPGAA
jgi:hypothetical protein